MRFCEFLIMIPALYFLLALRSLLPPDLPAERVYFLVVLVLSGIGWGGIARVVRGMALSIRQREFVEASRALGRSHGFILARHVVPHTFSYLAVVLSLSVPGYIIAESALSVLGLGIQEPAVSWGNLLTDALSVPHLMLHPWMLAPGFFIAGTAFSCYAVADGLRAALSGEEP
jgi:peptide/nickel transport system permease protein